MEIFSINKFQNTNLVYCHEDDTLQYFFIPYFSLNRTMGFIFSDDQPCAIYHVFSKTNTTHLFINPTLPLVSTSILKKLTLCWESFPLWFTLELSFFNGKMFRAIFRLSSRWPPEMMFIYKHVCSDTRESTRIFWCIRSVLWPISVNHCHLKKNTIKIPLMLCAYNITWLCFV